MDLNANVRTSRIAILHIQRPWAAAIVAFGLYAVVFAMRLMIHGTDPITVFYVFPVALLAMTYGSRAGVVAGVIGVLLIVAWGAIDNVAADPLGWLGRVAPIMLLGLLVVALDRARPDLRVRPEILEPRRDHCFTVTSSSAGNGFSPLSMAVSRVRNSFSAAAFVAKPESHL